MSGLLGTRFVVPPEMGHVAGCGFIQCFCFPRWWCNDWFCAFLGILFYCALAVAEDAHTKTTDLLHAIAAQTPKGSTGQCRFLVEVVDVDAELKANQKLFHLATCAEIAVCDKSLRKRLRVGSWKELLLHVTHIQEAREA